MHVRVFLTASWTSGIKSLSQGNFLPFRKGHFFKFKMPLRVTYCTLEMPRNMFLRVQLSSIAELQNRAKMIADFGQKVEFHKISFAQAMTSNFVLNYISFKFPWFFVFWSSFKKLSLEGYYNFCVSNILCHLTPSVNSKFNTFNT